MHKTMIVLSGLLAVTALSLGQPAAAQNASAPSQTPPPADARGPAIQAHQMIDLDSLLERLGRDLGKEFVVSPVAPRMLASVDTNVRTASLDSLRALLRANSLIAISSGDQILILPDAFARTMPTRIVQTDDADVSDHEIVTRKRDARSDVGHQQAGDRGLLRQRQAHHGDDQGTDELT